MLHAEFENAKNVNPQKSKNDKFGYRELNPALPGYYASAVRAGDASRYTISEM